MQRYFYYFLILSIAITLGCGNIKTEPVILDTNADPLNPNPDPIIEPTVSTKSIVISDQELAVEKNKNVNIDLSTLITNFDATKEYVYIIITPPSNGLVSIQNELLTYTPSSTGTDIIEFKASTNDAESNIGQLTITINDIVAPNTTPLVLLDTTLKVLEDQQEQLNLSSIIKDFSSSENYNFKIVEQPKLGQIVINGLSLTYTPLNNVTGNDTITLQAGDGNSTSNIAKISIEIQNLSNSAPRLDLKEFEVKENTPIQVDLLTLLLPPHPFDSKEYTFKAIQPVPNGTVTITSNSLTYTPKTSFLGKDESIKILVTDDLDQTDEVKIIFNVVQ